MEGIWNLINFVQIGGAFTIVGGLIGYYFGHQVASSCSNACFSGSALAGLGECLNKCPDAFMYAVIGTLPGIFIAIVEYFVKKSGNPV